MAVFSRGLRRVLRELKRLEPVSNAFKAPPALSHNDITAA
jgi:hypothetical protein